jgi:transcriptional regulator with XRE-family HTH domain
VKNKLAECLAERKIRQSQLAYRLRKSPAYVSRLCRGQILPGIEAALLISRYLKKPVDQIFQLAEPEPISPASLGSVGKQTNNPTETTKGK